MPELPEVETIVRGLNRKLLGRTILDVEVFKPLVVKEKPSLFRAHLLNKKMCGISRHGKAIFISVDTGRNLRVHLGMTGQLLFLPKDQSPDSYTCVLFCLDEKGNNLHYRDVRQFGRLEMSNHTRQVEWGPDAWLSSKEEILKALRQKNGMIKHALLNQHVLAGLGNIYVDESLFRAHIHPKKKLQRLNKDKLGELCDAIRIVLGESIDLGGTSFRNYTDTQGGRGGYKGRLNVYGKEGKPCPVCKTLIRRIVVASRGTHFCPRCQKR